MGDSTIVEAVTPVLKQNTKTKKQMPHSNVCDISLKNLLSVPHQPLTTESFPPVIRLFLLWVKEEPGVRRVDSSIRGDGVSDLHVNTSFTIKFVVQGLFGCKYCLAVFELVSQRRFVFFSLTVWRRSHCCIQEVGILLLKWLGTPICLCCSVWSHNTHCLSLVTVFLLLH